MSLNTLEQASLIRMLSRLEERLSQVERMLSGQPIATVQIGDAVITNAKIVTVAVDKLTAGDLIVAVDVGNTATGYTRIDGPNSRILINDGTNNRVVMGNI